MYISLAEARETALERWNDKKLRKKIHNYVGKIPDFMHKNPCSVLIRHVPSPNLEFVSFMDAQKEIGFETFCTGFKGDKFCTMNPDKIALGKMTFFHGKGRNGGDKITSVKTLSANKCEGALFEEIKTIWNEDFVGMHRELLLSQFPEIQVTDITDWLGEMGGIPSLFWRRILGLFVCHGILFENFHNDGFEKKFTDTIIKPALADVKDKLGLSPLIVPIVPVEEEREVKWRWYPGHLEQDVRFRRDGGFVAQKQGIARKLGSAKGAGSEQRDFSVNQ